MPQKYAEWQLYESQRGGGPDPKRCAAGVHIKTRLGGFHQCTRKPVVTECGHGWCKQHAPSTEIARRDARNARWAAQDRMSRVRRDIDSTRREAADTALRYFRQQATHDELETAVNAYAAALDAVAALSLGVKD